MWPTPPGLSVGPSCEVLWAFTIRILTEKNPDDLDRMDSHSVPVLSIILTRVIVEKWTAVLLIVHVY